MTEIKKSKTYETAYLLDEISLRQINDLFATVVPNIYYEFETNDNATIKYDSLEEFLKFPNTVKHQIKKLSVRTAVSIKEKHELPSLIEGQPPQFIDIPKIIDTSIYVWFYTHKSQNIQLIVTGNDPKEVFYYFDEVEKKIEMLKRSKIYSFAAHVNIGLVLSVLVSLYGAFGVITHWPRTSILDNGIQPVVLLCTILILPTVAYFILASYLFKFLDYLQNMIFPVATFAVGDGVKRDQRAEAWRQTVLLGGIGLPLLFWLVQSLLSR